MDALLKIRYLEQGRFEDVFVFESSAARERFVAELVAEGGEWEEQHVLHKVWDEDLPEEDYWILLDSGDAPQAHDIYWHRMVWLREQWICGCEVCAGRGYNQPDEPNVAQNAEARARLLDGEAPPAKRALYEVSLDGPQSELEPS